MLFNKKTKKSRKEDITEIILAAQQGNTDAFAKLFDYCYNDIFRIAMSNVNDYDLACDLTQEAFIEIFNTIKSLREPAAFRSWMKKVTYHRCTNYYKSKEYKHETVISDSDDINDFFENMEEDRAQFVPEASLDAKELIALIRSFLKELPKEQHDAVVMYYFDDISLSEIAEIQGVPEATVKSRLFYARKSLKKLIEDYEKENDIKLHSIPFIPLLLKAIEPNELNLSADAKEKIAEKISSETGMKLSSSAATPIASGPIAAIKSLPILAKIGLALAAATVISAPVIIGISKHTHKDLEKPVAETFETVPETTFLNNPVQEETLPPEAEAIVPEYWIDHSDIEFSPTGSFTYTLSYTDKVTILGVADIPSNITIAESTSECEEGLKKQRLYWTSDISQIPDETSFSLGFTPFDKYTGKTFEFGEKLNEVKSQSSQFIVEFNGTQYPVEICIQGSQYSEKLIINIEITCPIDYDGFALAIRDNYPDKLTQEEPTSIAHMDNIDYKNTYQYFFTSTVAPEDLVPVTNIAIETGEVYLAVNSGTTLNFTTLPENATYKGVSWSSDNTSVATVTQCGEIYGVSEGTAYITVKSLTNPEVYSTYTIIVKEDKEPDPTGLTFTEADIGKVVGFDFYSCKDIVILYFFDYPCGEHTYKRNAVYGYINDYGEQVLFSNFNVLICNYCNQFPCPYGGGEACAYYDSSKANKGSAQSNDTEATDPDTQAPETQAPVSDPSQLTSGNLTPEQKEGLEQNRRSCRYCGNPKSIHHFSPTEDANCPYCGTFVPEGECHDCGNDD